MGGKGGGQKIPTTSELMEMAEFENTINNPNVSNMFGSQTFTRGADGRQTATQELDPRMQGLMDGIIGNLAKGPSQFQVQGNQHTQDMMNMFNSRVGERSGFQPAPFQGAQIQPPQSYGTPTVDGGAQDPTVEPPTGYGGVSPDFGGLDGGLGTFNIPLANETGANRAKELQEKVGKYSDIANNQIGGIGGAIAGGIGALMQRSNQKKLDAVMAGQDARKKLQQFDRGL